MLLKGLILLLFVALGQLPAGVSELPMSSSGRLECHDTERPQWTDLGMHDVLAVTATSVVAPPPTARTAQRVPTALSPTAHLGHPSHKGEVRQHTDAPTRLRQGHLHRLCCLRL